MDVYLADSWLDSTKNLTLAEKGRAFDFYVNLRSGSENLQLKKMQRVRTANVWRGDV